MKTKEVIVKAVKGSSQIIKRLADLILKTTGFQTVFEL